ncbi:MAG: xanthine dehydrogenase family protein molybdopterin-binding subunit [Dehalococcoidia bacterium]|nr:xanthine dehydrogenase family protein molybdopterin-binding subunit [Dehalococcoidia bacterium]
MTTTEKKPEYKVIGTRPIRPDGLDKVTGRARYAADIQLPGLLHGKVLRSPHTHARIKSIDTSAAEKLPGVRAIITGQDIPVGSDRIQDMGEQASRLRFIGENVLARNKVLYTGHAIAAIAATTPHIAEEAARLIKVDYEVLPTAVTVLDAMKDDAPLLHEDMTTQELGQKSTKKSNIASHLRFEKGNIAEGFKQADLVIEREYHGKSVHQGYIEPQAATAIWATDGQITIWSTTQGAFNFRTIIAQVLKLPESRIKVIPTEIGGGFGGKNFPYLEPMAALLSKKSGRPVKLIMTRPEVFEATGPTPGSYIKLKMGVNKEGRITAADIALYYEAGAFPGSPVNAGAMCAFGPYNLENARVDGYDVVCNKPKTAAYRAPGAPNAAFAVETVIDEICEKLNMNPVDFRILNGVKEGDRRVDGPAFARIGYQEVLQAVKDHPHWKTPLTGKNRGRGFATGFWFNGGGPSSCYISVNSDGSLSMVEGSTDIGGHRASMAMVAAEVLGVPYDSIKTSVGDTDSIGYTSLTAGSSAAFKTSIATHDAAEDVKRQMVQRVAKIWETTPENVQFKDGMFSLKPALERHMPFAELAGKLLGSGGPITGRASIEARVPHNGFCANLVDLEVDPDTGKVTILRYTAFQDVGKAIHPSYVEGQMQGGTVQGIGWALNEEYVFNQNGQMSNTSFLDYRMPTALDVPFIDTVMVEVPTVGHPYGVRGVGEPPIVPTLGAIANALHRAIGVRMTETPMSPSKVLETKWKADPAKSKNGAKH